MSKRGLSGSPNKKTYKKFRNPYNGLGYVGSTKATGDGKVQGWIPGRKKN